MEVVATSFNLLVFRDFVGFGDKGGKWRVEFAD
jgi:hypothetical protein